MSFSWLPVAFWDPYLSLFGTRIFIYLDYVSLGGIPICPVFPFWDLPLFCKMEKIAGSGKNSVSF